MKKESLIASINELEHILKTYGDCQAQSPFNPRYTWLVIKEKLATRLQQKKRLLLKK